MIELAALRGDELHRGQRRKHAEELFMRRNRLNTGLMQECQMPLDQLNGALD